MTKFTIDKKLAFFLIISFIVATVLGTLSHELGHCVVAKYYGYNVFIHFGSMHWEDDANDDFIDTTYEKYKDSIKQNPYFDFPDKKRYDQVLKKHRKDGFWISAGGPIQTILFGTIGFLLLLFFKKSFTNKDRLTIWQWGLIFLASFWLRQIANFLAGIGVYIFTGKWFITGDEGVLSHHLKINNGSINATTALIASILLSFVYFTFTPKSQRLTFLVSGLIGSVLGAILWLIVLGPLLMP